MKGEKFMGKELANKLIVEGEKSQAVRKKLVERTTKSAAVRSSGEETLAQEIVGTVQLPHPIYIDSAEGPYLTDVDGNEYIDLTGGFGPNVLGNKPAVVEEALIGQVKKGWHFGIPSAPQQHLADIIKEAGACVDHVVFCNSGTEATMFAIRAARAFTGKQKIGLFDGSYHGVHDYALVKVDESSDRSRPTANFLGAGVPPVIADGLSVTLPYRDEMAYEIIREQKEDLAVVLVEPVQSSNPRLDTGEFLHGLKEVCEECGVLFMLDEVITGFRIEYGGCQTYYDIKPDLVTYGKAVGGGLPIGAIGGREDIMNTFSGKGAPYIFTGGTFSGNPLTMTAGLAAATYMRDHQDEIYPYLMEQGNRLASEVNSFCELHQIPAQIMNAGSMFHLVFTGGEINSSRDLTDNLRIAEREFYLHLLGHDVIVPGIHLAFLSYAHRPEHVDTVIEAFRNSFEDIRADGFI
jgi:glutamate-1-semialdehyde 2,1-aminomutase